MEEEPFRLYQGNRGSTPVAALKPNWLVLMMLPPRSFGPNSSWRSRDQRYGITSNILFQDNQSAILLETNGQKSSSKRTRALNIRYFFLADQVAKGNLDILYLPTDAMWGDYMTKPLQGKLFQRFRKAIMGMEP